MGDLFTSLSQPSAWRGLTMLLTVFGVNVSPELSTSIMTTGASIIGMIGLLVKD